MSIKTLLFAAAPPILAPVTRCSSSTPPLGVALKVPGLEVEAGGGGGPLKDVSVSAAVSHLD